MYWKRVKADRHASSFIAGIAICMCGYIVVVVVLLYYIYSHHRLGMDKDYNLLLAAPPMQ